MGVSHSEPEFRRKIVKAAMNMEHANREATERAAKHSVAVLNTTIASMAGPDRRMHNAPRPNRPSLMSAKHGFTTGTKRALVKVGPKGPVALIDQGAPPHVIGFGRGEKASKLGKRSRRTVLPDFGIGYSNLEAQRPMQLEGDRWRSGPFVHPGTRGRHKWVPTRDKVLPRQIRPILVGAHTKAIGRAFR